MLSKDVIRAQTEEMLADHYAMSVDEIRALGDFRFNDRRLQMDSMETVDLVLEVEDRFNVFLPDVLVENVIVRGGIRELVDYIADPVAQIRWRDSDDR